MSDSATQKVAFESMSSEQSDFSDQIMKRMNARRAFEAAALARRDAVAGHDMSGPFKSAHMVAGTRAARTAFATHMPPGWSDRPPPPNDLSPTLLSPTPFRVAAGILLVLACLTAGTLAVLEIPAAQSSGASRSF